MTLTKWFTRTSALVKLNLRRDWTQLVLWCVVLAGLMTAVAAKFDQIYGSQRALNEIVKTLKTPAMVALFGPMTAKPPYTTAAVFAAEMLVFMALFMVIMNVIIGVRATRHDEDAGLTELVTAHAVGRGAPLLAAIVELTGLNLILGCGYGLGLQLAAMPGADSTGNWLIGFGLAAVGWAFGMLTLVMAQLADSAGGTSRLSFAVLGLLFVLRMSTDVSDPQLTWWVPFGWVEKISAYQANDWAPVWAYLLLGLLLAVLAIVIRLRRDLGAGVIATRRGRQRASWWLRGPVGLVWRQARGGLVAWLVANFVLGAAYGSVFNTIGDLAKTNPMIKQLLGTSALAAANRLVVKNFVAVLAIVMVIIALIPAIQLTLKLVGDEQKGYLHQVGATAAARWHVWAAYTGWGALAGAAVLLAGLAGMAVMGAITMNDSLAWASYWHVWLAYLPAMLVMIAVASLLVGWLPKWRYLAWGWLGYSFFAVYLGTLLTLPEWAQHLSPLGFVDRVPVKAIDWSVSWWCLGLTVLLLGLAAIGYRRRDLAQ
ncbi:ABC transporter permease [Lactiplantibacillus plajomi]|uniref:ABC transporter permease n=1 Tax=Lactiplantibacillus plajomi TaxID=1457217 RepID=A0ABV6K641_9LACO|nr:ABC transporter permease [Lactiplantibacillus plajomi]